MNIADMKLLVQKRKLQCESFFNFFKQAAGMNHIKMLLWGKCTIAN